MTIELTANLFGFLGLSFIIIAAITAILGVGKWKSFALPKSLFWLAMASLITCMVLDNNELMLCQTETLQKEIQEHLPDQWAVIYESISRENNKLINTIIVNKLLTPDMPPLSLKGLKLLISKGLSNTTKVEPFIAIDLPVDNVMNHVEKELKN